MQIIIKILKGQDCKLEVTPTTTVLEIKQEIEKILKIPFQNQKMLLLGRSLNDENTLAFYPNIKDGTKMNLVVMRPEGLRDAIYRSFRRYYNEPQSERLTYEFMKDFQRKLKYLSLDDIERICDILIRN